MKKLLIIPLSFLLGSCGPRVEQYIIDNQVVTCVWYRQGRAHRSSVPINSPDSVIEAQYKEAERIASKLKKLR